MVTYIIIGLIAYLIGSINFSVIISKKMVGFDVRDKGSGNAGTANVLREVGKRAAVLTLICDVLKGVIAVIIAFTIGRIIGDSINGLLLIQIAGLCVLLGHTFPIFFRFRGGKGVATGLGIILICNYQIGLICLVFYIVLILLTRISAVGSLAATILFPVLALFIKEHYLVPGNYVIFGIIVAAFILINHRENIKRLLSGNENRIKLKK